MYLPDNGAYSALKAALAHISLTAKEELKDDKIAVTVVYPYITLTDFEKNTIKDASVQEQQETVGRAASMGKSRLSRIRCAIDS